MKKEIIVLSIAGFMVVVCVTGAILAQVFGVPNLGEACIVGFFSTLSFVLGGKVMGNGTASGAVGLLLASSLGVTMLASGCATGSGQSLPARCAVEAASAAVTTFAQCCLEGGSTARCTSPDADLDAAVEPLGSSGPQGRRKAAKRKKGKAGYRVNGKRVYKVKGKTASRKKTYRTKGSALRALKKKR